MKKTTFEKVTYITPKGLERLEGELNHLRTARRGEIAQYLQETMGDSEEAEYLLAIEEQAFVEGRIHQLEMLLNNFRVIEPGQSNNGLVEVGNTVVVRENNVDAETYTIVGAAEANPGEGLISNESPLGKALLGSRVGDDLEIKAPAGLLKFRVLAVH
ncbi:MAG: transcription elongation factor GreA [Chloroflexi bacterium]|nr:transcription elongation factor GreA [Chloroflexota bacterium]MBU1661763.1 transcription elongation factor GreA [Chloroflexota bacterium]